MTQPVVAVYVLGGTITMTPGSTGITPKLDGKDLVAQVPALADIARLDVHTPFLKPGASLAMTDLATVAGTIGQLKNHAGAVVVQGTDTIDETAYLLHLLYDGDAPVIVTGAMRGASASSADGPANLLAAVTAAASPLLRRQGVLVVLNDEIHSATSAEKMHTGLCSAFQSPNGGPLAYCLEGQVRLLRTLPARRHPALSPGRFGRVALIKVSLDDQPDLLDALPQLGYEGAVIEAMGAGHTPAHWAAPLEALAQRMPVVLSTRVIGGPVFQRTYGFPGSEIDLLQRGLIAGGWLSAHKARLLLAVAIGAGLAPEQIRARFQD